MKTADDIDFDAIVQDTQGFVGADLAQLCHEAAMQVIFSNTLACLTWLGLAL